MRFKKGYRGIASNRGVLALALVLSFCLINSVASAQDYTVSGVEVKGNRTVDRSLILSVSDLSIGSILTSTATQDAIKRVYGLGLFSDVRIEGDMHGDSIDLDLIVVEFPRLNEVAYNGRDKVGRDDLDDALAMKKGQVVTPNLIQKSIIALQTVYRDKGYFLAEIRYEEGAESEKGFVDVIFNIDENRKIKIRKIEFVGNEAFDDGKLRGKMSNKQKSFFRSGTFNKSKFPEDKEKVVEFYNEKGYIDAHIVRDTIIVDEDLHGLRIEIEVEEGDRYRFGKTTFAGHELFTDERLASKLKYDEGDVYNKEKFEESMFELYSIYQEEGHIHVRIFDNHVTRDSTLNIDFEISEGVPAKINLVQIDGNTKTKEKVIRRELFSVPGAIFRRSILVRSVRNVMVLDYFENVTPDFRVLDNGDVDLVMSVVEKPTGKFNVGAGYSEQDRFVGTIGLGIPNFRGNGQSVNLNVEFGGRRNSYSLGFTEPWLLDTPTSFGVDLYSLNRRWYEDYTEGRRGFGVRIGRRLRWPDDYFRIYWRYRLEDVRYYEISANAAREILNLNRFGGRWLRTSSTSITLVRDSRNLPQFATKGSTVSYQWEYSGGLVGGDWRFNKHIFQAAKFQRIWWKIALAVKAKVGVLFAPHGESEIPYSEMFAVGGTNSDGTIRGYGEGDVSAGDFIRGRSMVVYNAELQVPIVEQQVYALLLGDAGNVWRKPDDFRLFDAKSFYGSYGFGVRLVVPGMGIIGFDFAKGLSSIDKGWKPHFQFGTTF